MKENFEENIKNRAKWLYATNNGSMYDCINQSISDLRVLDKVAIICRELDIIVSDYINSMMATIGI